MEYATVLEGALIAYDKLHTVRCSWVHFPILCDCGYRAIADRRTTENRSITRLRVDHGSHVLGGESWDRLPLIIISSEIALALDKGIFQPCQRPAAHVLGLQSLSGPLLRLSLVVWLGRRARHPAL